jgi:hypothetical protein
MTIFLTFLSSFLSGVIPGLLKAIFDIKDANNVAIQVKRDDARYDVFATYKRM